ncbi:MAG: ABC transporter substrate-binding protein [Alphaproteobacteria bacterium]
MRNTKTAGLSLILAAVISSSAAVQAAPVKVGVITTLSTKAGYLGDDIRKGMELAIERDGTGAIELVVEDNGRNPENARQIAERMVSRDGIKILTGIVFSNVAMAVVPKVVRQGIIYVSPNAGPSALAGKGCNENYFNAAWQNDNLHEAMGKFVKDKGYKDVFILAPNYPAGKDALAGFKRFYSGGSSDGIAGEIYTKLGQTDYAAELAKLRAAKPDAVFFFLPGGMGINFTKQFAQAGLAGKVPAFGPAFSFDDTILDALGDSAVGIFNTSQWSPDLDNAANKEFVAAYKAKYNKNPTLYASQGYDTGNLLISALKATGGMADDVVALRKAIAKADFTSVRGAFKFGNNQHPIQDIYVRVAYKDATGNMTNKLVGKVFENHQDAYAKDCKM